MEINGNKKGGDKMNKRIKKVIAITMIIGMGVGTLALTGCGNKKSGNEESKDKAKVEKTADKKSDSAKEKRSKKEKKKESKASKKKPQTEAKASNKAKATRSTVKRAVKPARKVKKVNSHKKGHTVVKDKTTWKEKIGEGRYAEGGDTKKMPKDWQDDLF